MAALPYQMATAEPKQYLQFCDSLLQAKRLDMFLQNIRYRSRSVYEVGPRAIQTRLQRCISMARSKNQVALCRFLMMRNTEHFAENEDDGVDRRFPEYRAAGPIFRYVGNAVDDASCRLYLLKTHPASEQLELATGIRREFMKLGFPGMAFDCLLDYEIPLCIKEDMTEQTVFADDLTSRLCILAKLEGLINGPRNCYIRVYDNLMAWMSAAKNVYSLTIITEFAEMLWLECEPARYQAITLSSRICESHALITKTLNGPFPSQRWAKINHESAWRYVTYAKVWQDDNLFSEALSHALHWDVVLASFSATNLEMVPKLEEAEELAILGIAKDRNEGRYLDAVKKCCVVVQVAMLHPDRPRSISEVEHYRLGRVIATRTGDEGKSLLDSVAREFELADGERKKPLSVEKRARKLQKEQYESWSDKTSKDAELASFTIKLSSRQKMFWKESDASSGTSDQ